MKTEGLRRNKKARASGLPFVAETYAWCRYIHGHRAVDRLKCRQRWGNLSIYLTGRSTPSTDRWRIYGRLPEALQVAPGFLVEMAGAGRQGVRHISAGQRHPLRSAARIGYRCVNQADRRCAW